MKPRLPPVGTAGRRSAGQEYSAGGVVTDGGKLLLVQVENLKKEKVWTFPKGHLDPGETPRQAALREVEEETGYACEVVAPLILVKYMFYREGRLVRKQVRWYWMRPVEKRGKPDAVEVFDVAWRTPAQAREVLKYQGDKRLLKLIEPKLPLPEGEGRGEGA